MPGSLRLGNIVANGKPRSTSAGDGSLHQLGLQDVQKCQLHVTRFLRCHIDISNIPFCKTVASGIVCGARHMRNP